MGWRDYTKEAHTVVFRHPAQMGRRYNWILSFILIKVTAGHIHQNFTSKLGKCESRRFFSVGLKAIAAVSYCNYLQNDMYLQSSYVPTWNEQILNTPFF